MSSTNPYIISADVNLFGGLFSGSIPFEAGLNIISGENGTCKTNLLREIRARHIQVSNNIPTINIKIQAFSPKRNSERKSIERVFQDLRSLNQDFNTYIQQRAQVEFRDDVFEKYPSLGELYYFLFELSCKDGGDRTERMRQVTQRFNCIIKKIFENYELVATWDNQRGSPKITLKKDNLPEISLESLSCGEQEILSLVMNIYASRDSYDVFLIDEPEIHLNWHLEERLFKFLDWFCSEHNKQVIVVTHSRVAFKSPFLKKTQFLFWNNGGISSSKSITDEQRKRIAGEAIDIIKLGDFSKPTFFVEDSSQREVIESIAAILGKEVAVSECGTSSNVKAMFRYSLTDGGWSNSYFLIDGDNEGNPFPDKEQFIHLDKYCIENYLLDLSTAMRLTDKTENELKEIILRLTRLNGAKILKKNKYLEFLLERLKVEDITESFLDKLDASEIFQNYINEIGMARSAYITEYVKLLHSESRLEGIFPSTLIDIIKR